MRKLISLSAAVVMMMGSLVAVPHQANAEGGQIAAGVAGGLLGGLLLGGALAGQPAYADPPPVYYAPPVYVDEPVCRVIRQQYGDGYGYRIRRVQICD